MIQAIVAVARAFVILSFPGACEVLSRLIFRVLAIFSDEAVVAVRFLLKLGAPPICKLPVDTVQAKLAVLIFNNTPSSRTCAWVVVIPNRT